VSHSDLPQEFSGPLDFVQLLALLDALDGERVGVQALPLDGSDMVSCVAIAGTLRRLAPDGLMGNCFAIGDGARLVLAEEDYRSAHLATYDGNDFFKLSIQLRTGSILLGDVIITGVDYLIPEAE